MPRPGEVLVLLAKSATGEWRALLVELEQPRIDEWRVRIRSCGNERGTLCASRDTREGALCAAMGFPS